MQLCIFFFLMLLFNKSCGGPSQTWTADWKFQTLVGFAPFSCGYFSFVSSFLYVGLSPKSRICVSYLVTVVDHKFLLRVDI